VPGWADRIRADPSALIGARPAALHEVLDEVSDAFVRRPPPLLAEIPSDRPVVTIGDSHGDWPAVSAALTFARRGRVPSRFVGLGDYVHRMTRSQPDPAELPHGSVWNAAYLLSWAAHDPENVILLRGNHEATRQLPVPGSTLLRELRRAYPRTDALPLWERLMSLLERLPLAGRTANGVFLAHGGIPPAGLLDPTAWSADNLALLEGLLWSDPELDYEDRAVGYAYGARDLSAFLDTVGCRVMIKGHAPGHTGRSIYGDTLLTIHTSDLFERSGEGGVFLAEIPPRPRIERASEIVLRSWDGATWRLRPVRIVPDGTSARSDPRPAKGAGPLPSAARRS
jgi:Calcineurin-like phosphoesterase